MTLQYWHRRNEALDFPLFCRWPSFHWAHGLSHFSKCASRRLSISFLMSLMSVNRSQRVTSQFLPAPSNSKMNSSTSPRWSRYFSRRCCLQMSAVCFCRFLVPNPILSAEFLYRIPAAHYARDLLLLNLAIISSGSQFAVLDLFHNCSERKAQFRIRIH